MIQIKRIYEPASDDDGMRILVDRIWPRGISRFDAKIDHWEKDVAPTTELRKWFAHKPERWNEFQKRYSAELKTNPAFDALRKQIGKKRTTLLYSARDALRNQAVVLCGQLKEVSGKGAKAAPAKTTSVKTPTVKKPRAKAVRSASPVCYAEDADPAYMGYLSRRETVAFLNTMLEDAQAAMRVALESEQQATTKKIQALLAAIHQGESHWHAMLRDAIRSHGATPSPRTSDFYARAMAVPDLQARLVFLARCQERMVCKLKETLPGIQDDGLYRDLRAMATAHETSIRQINTSIASRSGTSHHRKTVR
jgi:uncharacterized protein YeaO (DUF488 family)